MVIWLLELSSVPCEQGQGPLNPIPSTQSLCISHLKSTFHGMVKLPLQLARDNIERIRDQDTTANLVQSVPLHATWARSLSRGSILTCVFVRSISHSYHPVNDTTMRSWLHKFEQASIMSRNIPRNLTRCCRRCKIKGPRPSSREMTPHPRRPKYRRAPPTACIHHC
jgi:hypothetical protein